MMGTWAWGCLKKRAEVITLLRQPHPQGAASKGANRQGSCEPLNSSSGERWGQGDMPEECRKGNMAPLNSRGNEAHIYTGVGLAWDHEGAMLGRGPSETCGVMSHRGDTGAMSCSTTVSH